LQIIITLERCDTEKEIQTPTKYSTPTKYKDRKFFFFL